MSRPTGLGGDGVSFMILYEGGDLSGADPATVATGGRAGCDSMGVGPSSVSFSHLDEAIEGTVVALCGEAARPLSLNGSPDVDLGVREWK